MKRRGTDLVRHYRQDFDLTNRLDYRFVERI
jgi:hypothetical protein